MKNPIILAFAVLFMMSCATTEKQARTEGCAGGAVIGAVLGLVGAKVFDADEKWAVAIGAVGGALAGCSYANRIVERQQALEGKENDLDARIQFARGVNDDTRAYNQQLVKKVEALEPQIDALVVQINQNQISQDQVERKRKALNAEVKDAQQGLNALQTELADLKNFRAMQAVPSAELDAEIAALEASLEQLQQNTNALASLSQRI